MIQLSKPHINEDDIQRVTSVLRSGNLVQGKEVQLLEEKIAKYIGVDHAICVSSGTATLHLSLIALGIGPGDEVIVPAFSYIATANVVELVGAKPVFIDINLDTFNIDVNKIEAAITSKTKAIIPVHEFGLASDITQIINISKKYNLFVIEDAACALGAKEFNKFIGSFGNVGSFSFHPRKAITSGEGGVVTTNKKSLATKIKVLRNHGIEYNDGRMDFVMAGFNYRMTDFQAALVSSQFDRFEFMLNKRQQLAEVYLKEIHNPIITLPSIPINKNHTWQTFHLLLRTEKERNSMIEFLKTNEIMSNYGAQCIPHMTYYMNKYKKKSPIEYPNAFKAYTCGLAIPLYDQLTQEQVKNISKSINKFK
jgi:dTDP-4-amino-4,6-dideoxygalactose transaminase